MAALKPSSVDLDLDAFAEEGVDDDSTRVLPPGALIPGTAGVGRPVVAAVATPSAASADDDDPDQVTRIMPVPAVRPAVAPAAPAAPATPAPAHVPPRAASTAGPLATPVSTATPSPSLSQSPPTLRGVAPTGMTPAPSTARPGTLTGFSTFGSRSTNGAAQAGDNAPRQVGRYQIVSRLGRGGMASVYRATDPSIGRDIAIKFLHASLAEDEECRMRFLREARAAGSLSHPNIVTVHDVGELEGRPFMAMELLAGESLAEVLEKQPMLTIRDVATMGLQVARALEYAHARGIVHRDIKPGNIMLLADGSAVKVTDFGIAHLDEGSGSQQTVIGSVLGTPQYMSPEQTRGEKLDGRSDLFSFGIVLYQSLTGERPFKGEHMVAVAQQIATAEPAPITAKRPDTPASLRRIVERCLAKQPAQRWANGAELAAAFRKVLDELDSAEADRNKPKIVPLRVKWALLMGTIVAIVMGLTATIITQRQYSALMSQASDYGAALTRFIAVQNAAPVLGEDWDAVDVAVQEIMKTRNFERITVIDSNGTVRSATMPGQVGQPYRPPAAQSLGSLAGGVAATRYHVAGAPVLGFEAPVMFRDRQVGRVALGIAEQPLAEVARLSISLMVVLAVVTVLAVAVAMYFVANWFARPIQLVIDSLAELTQGRYGHRINETRADEFGPLFVAVDRLAMALQRREQEGAAMPALKPSSPNEPAAKR